MPSNAFTSTGQQAMGRHDRRRRVLPEPVRHQGAAVDAVRHLVDCLCIVQPDFCFRFRLLALCKSSLLLARAIPALAGRHPASGERFVHRLRSQLHQRCRANSSLTRSARRAPSGVPAPADRFVRPLHRLGRSRLLGRCRRPLVVAKPRCALWPSHVHAREQDAHRCDSR